MTSQEKKLIDSYVTLINAGIKTINDVPERVITLDDGTESTIRAEVQARIAAAGVSTLS